MTSRVSSRPLFLFGLVLLFTVIGARIFYPVVSAAPAERGRVAFTILGGGVTSRVSVSSSGLQGNDASQYPSLSVDGRFVAFYSDANNLVAGDTNNVTDVFLHDRQTATTTRISLRSDGTQANGGSYYPAISATGRYITFVSLATNLVANDTNNTWDIFVHDRDTGQTRRASVASNGTQSNGTSLQPIISGDGRYVTFYSFGNNLVANDSNNAADIFSHDLNTGATERISMALDGSQTNGHSYGPSPSYDGRYITYYSYATNIVANDTNSVADVFVYDRLTTQSRRISRASDGTQGNGESLNSVISNNGQVIVYESHATNLVSNDTNATQDIFIFNVGTETTQRVSVASDGTQGNNTSADPTISDNGRYVAFHSDAINLVANDTNGLKDVFRHDVQQGETLRVSVATDDMQGNGDSTRVSLVGNGRYIAFDSLATNLVPSDTNGELDIFIRDLEGQAPTPTPTNTPLPGATFTATPTRTNTPPPGATFTATPTRTNTPPPGATFTPTPTQTNTPPPGATFTSTPTRTNTPPPGATFTSTPTAGTTATPSATPPSAPVALFLPVILQRHFYATPAPTPTAAPTCAALDQEPNNFFIEANTNLPLCAGATVVGNVSPSDIDDIYRIELSRSGITRIDLTHIQAGADYDLYLYNAERGEVTVSNTPGSVDESIRLNLPDGRYYVRVYSRRYGEVNTYQLRWIQE